MKAQNDRIIARVGYMKETSGGIVMASATMDDGKIATNIGRVITAGPGLMLRTGEYLPCVVKEGDVITWEQFGGIRYEILGKDLVCIRSEDIGCVLEPGEYENYLFTDEEIENYKRGVEAEREEFARKIREAQNAEKEKKVIYWCWNNDCKDKCEDVERLFGKDQCETCGAMMKEKGVAPMGHVTGGTPRFH